jgi:Zn finger protein HypA/HybF involved in hydrogenase expression
MKLRKTHEKFVEQANIIHHNKYLYLEKYAGDAVKINIYCKTHGNFKQQAGSHLQGNGCPFCAKEITKNKLIKSNSVFLEQAFKIHGDKYIYLEEYKGAKVKIKIKCKEHGIFLQNPDKHLKKCGCPKCAKNVKKTKEDFLLEANKIHNNKYIYIDDYINIVTPIKIKCFKHGEFNQTPDVHLNGHGCPQCGSNVSKMEIAWLDSLDIPNDNLHRSTRIKLGNSYIKPDAYVSSTNTIYEFYGDYWHGNLNIYPKDLINHKNKKTMLQLYNQTIDRQNKIINAGYNLICIWESDWKKIKNYNNSILTGAPSGPATTL